MEDLIQYLSSPAKDYAEGIRLLERYGDNPHLAHSYRQRSPRFAIDELVADLRLLSARNIHHRPSTPSIPSTPSAEPPLQPHPLKRQAGQLWVQISRLTTALYDTGQHNTPEAIAERKRLLLERAALIEQYEALWQKIEGGDNQPQSSDQQASNQQTIPQSDLGRYQHLRSVRQSINRYQNLLRYQSTRRQSADNPMPPCPRRTEIERLLAEKKKELDKLNKN